MLALRAVSLPPRPHLAVTSAARLAIELWAICACLPASHLVVVGDSVMRLVGFATSNAAPCYLCEMILNLLAFLNTVFDELYRRLRHLINPFR